MTDPYHFDTDPDPGCENICYRSGSRVNFDRDPDPGKNDMDPDPAKQDRIRIKVHPGSGSVINFFTSWIPIHIKII